MKKNALLTEQNVKSLPSSGQNQQEIIKEINNNTDMISSLIHEYLLKKDYPKTLDVFQEEISTKIKSKTYYKQSFQEINEINIMKSFALGNKADFFKQWNRIIPCHIKLKDLAYSKLEFYIEIYFAIFPILGDKKTITAQNQKDLKNNMDEFKKYLETKEIELSKTTEFLAYYALPYIPNLKDHPSYQQLFSPEWLNALKEKLKQCIKSCLPSLKYPVLYDLVSSSEEEEMKISAVRNHLENLTRSTSKSNSNNNNNINQNEPVVNNSNLEMENIKLIEENQKLKAKEEKSKIAFVDSQKTWTNLALNIISYSFDLVKILNKANVNDGNKQIEKINKKLIKYQQFLKKNCDELEKNKNNNSNIMIQKEDFEQISTSKNEESIHSQINTQIFNNINNNNNNTIGKEIQKDNNILQEKKSIQIDYEPTHLIDIKRFCLAINHKIQIDDNKLGFIFREIRVRCFRRSDLKLRQLTLFSIFYYDIFNVLSKTSTLLNNLLSNQILNLETIKLINLIANLYKGRNYLLSKPTLIDDIVQCLIREKSDTEFRQNCLGTIQKFTLRSQPQIRLIELNVIQYIVDIFTYQANSLSDYTIEYGLALIMNLSLRKAGREKFESVADKTLQILFNFMNKDSVQVLTCINGTLYSLLKRQKFKTEAKKFGLENILIKKNNTTNPQLKKQILYILEELNKPPEEDEFEENFEDESNGKDEDEMSYDEYTDMDSIDESVLEEHYKQLGDFIIRNDELNKIEEQRILQFMKSNPNMSRNMNKNPFNSISSSIRQEDVDRPLRRPTTPMTNMSMTGNSQKFGK